MHPAYPPRPNPGYGYGRAILGAAAGLLAGTAVAQGVTDVVVPLPEDGSVDAAQFERSRLLFSRLSLALGTFGAVSGAALAARPTDRVGAAVGTAAGVLAARGLGTFAPSQPTLQRAFVWVGVSVGALPLGTAAGIALGRRV